MIATFNAYHLGDNLVHLHFLRALAREYPDLEFGHYASAQHKAQLAPVVEDMANIKLLDTCPHDAINAWRGDGHYWHMHEQRNNFTWFHYDWFHYLAGKMGLKSPISQTEQFLFDYPALAPADGTDHFENPEFDVLVINSIPHSGQFRGWNPHDMDTLIQTLMDRGKKVITTFPSNTAATSTHDGTSGLSVTAIGRLSTRAKAIFGVVTGPSWTCMNAWNKDKNFVWMLDDELVNIMPKTWHVHSCAEALKYL